MWEFEYDAPRGKRIKRDMYAVDGNDMWFIPELDLWIKNEDLKPPLTYLNYSSHDHRVKSFRAFKRYLRKHPELKQAERVTLACLYYYDYPDGTRINTDIYAKWNEE